VDGRTFTIVGVIPAGFTLPYDSFVRLTDPVDLYMPLALDDPEAHVRRFHYLRLIGRLKSGESLQHAQSQMDVIARQLAATYPENDTWHLRLVPLHERIVGAVRPVLVILIFAVTLLLLVSCANVASLLLARANTRESELALRGALGASRARVVRQLLVEGFALSLGGGAAGLFITWWTVGILKRIGPAEFPRLDALAFEPRVVAFAVAAAAVTTLVFALAPAVHAARGNLAGAVRPGRAMTMDRSRRLGQRALVVGQLSVSIVLLAGAALLVRGFVHLVSIDAGFRAAGVMLTRLPLPPERYDTDAKIDAFHAALVERLTSTPGIDAAALATTPPLAGANDTAVHRQSRAPAAPRDRRFAQVRWIAGDYFGTLGIPLVAGRLFDDRLDRAKGPGVVIVSQSAAREHFGGEPAVGQTLVIDLGGPVNATVIGITADVRVFGQDNEPPPIVYFSARQRPIPVMQVVLRSALPVADVAAAIRSHVQALDPALAIGRIDRMEALMADSVAQPRFAMVLIGSFASLALILTLVGLYGTLAYLVAQRRREIGIRLAVGASRRDIRQMVLRQGATLIAIGIPLGLGASLFTSRLATAVIVGVRPADPLVLAGVTVLLTVASLAAVFVPASRAARIEPLEALRAE
jgi:putative ABC transport system permease protein